MVVLPRMPREATPKISLPLVTHQPLWAYALGLALDGVPSEALPRLMRVKAPDSASEQMEPLLRLDEVAALLRISKSGVFRLMKSGDLQVVRLGGRTLVRPDEVRRLIERCTIQRSREQV